MQVRGSLKFERLGLRLVSLPRVPGSVVAEDPSPGDKTITGGVMKMTTWSDVMRERGAIHRLIRTLSCSGSIEYPELERCKKKMDVPSTQLVILARVAQERSGDWSHSAPVLEAHRLLDEMGCVWSETLGPLYDLLSDLVRSPGEISEFLLALEPYPRIWEVLLTEAGIGNDDEPKEPCPYCFSINVDCRRGDLAGGGYEISIRCHECGQVSSTTIH